MTWQQLGSSRYRVLKTSLKKVGWYLQARSQSGLKFTSRIWGCITWVPDGTRAQGISLPEGGLGARGLGLGGRPARGGGREPAHATGRFGW